MDFYPLEIHDYNSDIVVLFYLMSNNLDWSIPTVEITEECPTYILVIICLKHISMKSTPNFIYTCYNLFKNIFLRSPYPAYIYTAYILLNIFLCQHSTYV